MVARRPDGEPFDHVTKVRQGQRGLVTRTTDAERPALEAELSEASRLLDRTEQFVPRPAPGDDT